MKGELLAVISMGPWISHPTGHGKYVPVAIRNCSPLGFADGWKEQNEEVRVMTISLTSVNTALHELCQI